MSEGKRRSSRRAEAAAGDPVSAEKWCDKEASTPMGHNEPREESPDGCVESAILTEGSEYEDMSRA